MSLSRHRFSHLLSKPKQLPDPVPTVVPTAVPAIVITIVAREPLPLDPTKSSLACLPELVVQRIFTFLRDEHPGHLHAVALLSSYLYGQARYVQHQDVHINLDNGTHALGRIQLIKRLMQSSAIRTLRVSGRKFDVGCQETSDFLANFLTMLPDMTALRDFHWDVRWTRPDSTGLRRGTTIPIPSPIMAVFPTELRLHLSLVCAETLEAHLQAREFLNRLQGSKHLCTLPISIYIADEQVCADTMPALKKVLLSCPNLTRIPMMDIQYPRGHSDDYGPSANGAPYCGLGFSNGERLPDLVEFGFNGYPWGVDGAIVCQGYPNKGREWDYWTDNFNWSQITRLNGMPGFLASRVALKLTALRELVVPLGFVMEMDFLSIANPPLELLRVGDWRQLDRDTELLVQFGTTLKHLTIHSTEPVCRYDDDTLITTSDLNQLNKSLYCLEHLVLDIERGQGEWPYEALDAIAAFPSLHTLEIWFTLGWERPGLAPALTSSSARYLYRYLRERNKNIQHVTLHSGSSVHTVRHLNGCPDPSPWPCWHQHNAITFICETVYSGQDAEEDGGGWLNVWCAELSSEMNAEMRLLEKQTDRQHLDLENIDRDRLRLIVAVDGPLNDGWGDWSYGERLRWRDAELEAEKKKPPPRKPTSTRLRCIWRR